MLFELKSLTLFYFLAVSVIGSSRCIKIKVLEIADNFVLVSQVLNRHETLNEKVCFNTIGQSTFDV